MVGWDRVAEAYDAGFGRLCSGTVDAVLDAALTGAGHPGTLLDVGTGAGSVGRSALSRRAVVHACDASASMIDFVGAVEPRVRLAVAALPHLPYADAAFDAVTANFVINHVADPLAAVREIARVTRRGGRAALTIWPGGPTALDQLWQDVVADAGAVAPPARRLDPAHEFDRTESGLADLLERAGLVTVDVRTVSWTFRVSAADLWAGVEAGIAGVGATFLAQPVELRDQMRAVFADRVDQGGDDGELALPASALLAVGAPSAVQGSVWRPV